MSGGGAAEAFGGGVVVAEPVGVAVEVEHDRAVQQSVEHGGGHGGVAEDFAPRTDAAVDGDHDGCFQIALRHNLKQGGGGLAGQRQVAQFVNLSRHRDKLTYADPVTMPTRSGLLNEGPG